MSLVVAISNTVIVGRGGVKIVVQQGAAWDADDPFVLAHPDLFSDEAGHARRVPADLIEDKLARPGRGRKGPKTGE